MSLIPCIECGTRISEHAKVCPHCGFCGNNPDLPIAIQGEFSPIPRIQIDISQWNPAANASFLASPADSALLFGMLGRWESITKNFPALAAIFQEMAKKESVLVAKIDSFIQRKLQSGEYKFSIDRNGELLPTIRDNQGIVHQVRLDRWAIPTQMTQAVTNLTAQAALSQILEGIKQIGQSILALHLELQGDRLALADSAYDQLMQALKIEDSRLREASILQAISTATEAKCALMRNITQGLTAIKAPSAKGSWIPGKSTPQTQAASDIMQSLVALTNAIQVECGGYSALGEPEAGQLCLAQFSHFLIENQLNDRNVLLIVNENLAQKQLEIVDSFTEIVKQIDGLGTTLQTGQIPLSFLAEENTQDEES